MKARTLALGASLALAALGGTALGGTALLPIHLPNLSLEHKALSSSVLSSGALRSRTPPSRTPPSTVLPSGVLPSPTLLSPAPPSPTSPSRALPSPTPRPVPGPSRARRVTDDCLAVPGTCGFPDSADTGVPSGMALRSVPGQVSRGPGWHFDAKGGYVVVTANGTVLSGLYIPGALEIEASHVTVKDVQVWGIGLRHTTGVTIEDSTIKGENATSGRVNQAIGDVYDDSTGIVIKDDNISNFRVAIQARTGLIEGNYIHNPGYIPGDHTDGIMATGSAQPMTITGNTIFINLGQCYAISLNASGPGQAVANKTVTGNFLAGGDYPIYAGDGWNDPTSNIVIKGNRFGQQFFPHSGEFGPLADFDPRGTGNAWSGNVWGTTGQDLPF